MDSEVEITGIASVEKNNIEKDWMRYRERWFQKDDFARNLFTKGGALPHFWKRVIITIIPVAITYKKDGSVNTFEMEVVP